MDGHGPRSVAINPIRMLSAKLAKKNGDVPIRDRPACRVRKHIARARAHALERIDRDIVERHDESALVMPLLSDRRMAASRRAPRDRCQTTSPDAPSQRARRSRG